jgi:hypothetical protein
MDGAFRRIDRQRFVVGAEAMAVRISVFLPTSENAWAFVYRVMSLVMVSVPKAPQPLA